MKLIFFLFFTILFSTTVKSQEIATINILEIINNHKIYNLFLENLEIKKDEYEKIIKNMENDIIKLELELEENKLILSENNLNKKINLLNSKYNELEKFIEKYNYYMDFNINHNKKKLIKEIADCVKEISLERNINLILNENNYFISNEKLDITEDTKKLLEIRNIEFKIIEEEKVFEN